MSECVKLRCIYIYIYVLKREESKSKTIARFSTCVVSVLCSEARVYKDR